MSRTVFSIFTLLVAMAVTGLPANAQPSSPQFTEEERISAPEANQAVAVDSSHVYAIDNHTIGKYEKETGARVARWEAGPDDPIHHLNSGIVINDTLYAAHSNFPGVPMVSSIELWDVDTMTHIGHQPLGMYEGSATWVDRHDGHWWVVFAHYKGDGGVPGKGPAWTRLVRFDDQWRRTGGWAFPESVIDRFRPYSNSGGAWGPDGQLYVTGHDTTAVYVLDRPDAGATLRLLDVVPFPGEGQGIAWDPSDPDVLYGIRRSERVVVRTRLQGARPQPGQ